MAPPTRTPLTAVAVAVALALAAGCATAELPPQSAAPAAPAELVEDAPAAAAALATIKVSPFPGRDPSYERDAFGAAWSDAGVGIQLARNGCDTRNDILRRDALPRTVQVKPNTGGCKVTDGEWVSPYTGKTIKTPSTLDIDHIVPLSRAWAAGAKVWTAQRRLNFANDPDNLVAADRSSNRSKGDLGPSAWRPPKQYQCAYGVRYVRAIKKYELPLTAADVAALRSMLGTCPAAAAAPS